MCRLSCVAQGDAGSSEPSMNTPKIHLREAPPLRHTNVGPSSFQHGSLQLQSSVVTGQQAAGAPQQFTHTARCIPSSMQCVGLQRPCPPLFVESPRAVAQDASHLALGVPSSLGPSGPAHRLPGALQNFKAIHGRTEPCKGVQLTKHF